VQVINQHPTPNVKIFGSIQITASQPVDGGYAINTHAASGGTRHDALCFTTRDRDLYRLAYRVIAEAGLTEAHPDDIHERLQDTLRAEFSRALDTRRHAYADAVDRLLDALTTPAQAAAEQAALAGIAANMRAARDRDESPRPRTIADLKRAYEADFARDRAARAQRSAAR
jgi:hypothetical protein